MLGTERRGEPLLAGELRFQRNRLSEFIRPYAKKARISSDSTRRNSHDCILVSTHCSLLESAVRAKRRGAFDTGAVSRTSLPLERVNRSLPALAVERKLGWNAFNPGTAGKPPEQCLPI